MNSVLLVVVLSAIYADSAGKTVGEGSFPGKFLPQKVVQTGSDIYHLHNGPIQQLSESGKSRPRRAVGNNIAISTQERDDCVHRHNELRAAEQASDMEYMTWNSELASMAKAHSSGCLFEHSSMTTDGYNVPYTTVGENLFYSPGKPNLTQAVEKWHEEISFYTYNTNKCQANQMCGHYTQVVWAKTREIGCGIANCTTLRLGGGASVKNAVLITCNYGPRGNYRGSKPYTRGEHCTKCPSDYTENNCKMKLCCKNCTEPRTGAKTGGGSGGGSGSVIFEKYSLYFVVLLIFQVIFLFC